MTKRGNKLLFLAVFTVLAVPLVFAGNAIAAYVGDNAKMNTSGGWDLPDDKGFCNTGIKRDGTMIFDMSIGNNRNDCFAKIWPSYTTQAACLASDKAGANAEGSHFWGSVCISGTNPNASISLKGLDRTRYMCEQKGGTYKQACQSNWIAMGPTWSAANKSQTSTAFATTGGTDGFCYTTVRLVGYDNVTGNATPDCPVPVAGSPGSGKLGYRWDSVNALCAYNYGVAGVAGGSVYYKDNTSELFFGPGTNFDTRGLTQGQCQAWGLGFSNHTTAGVFAAEPVDAAAGGSAIVASPITSVRAGCLSCHNSVTQYNSMSGRWKDSYLKQGHKNMLRKVTPGFPLGGPTSHGDFAIYTDWFLEAPKDPAESESGEPGGLPLGTFNWTNGTLTSNGDEIPAGIYSLMYIAGAMNEVLEPITWEGFSGSTPVTGRAVLNGNEGDYRCAACHVTGWSNSSQGICVVGSVAKPASGAGSVTTKAACDAIAGSKWYPMSGVQSNFPASTAAYLGTYQPNQPGASWTDCAAIAPFIAANNSIPGIVGRWDFDGINCNRCHKVAYDPTFPINDEGVHAPPGFTTHETEIFEGWKCVNTCYGCHQSGPVRTNGNIAAVGNDTDLNHPEAIPVSNAGSDNVANYKPYPGGHVIGNSFLNSPHAKFTGSVLPNEVGKFDITTGSTYNSHFVGKLCRSGTAVGGGSILETMVDGSFIKTREDCNVANGKDPVLGPATGSYWQNESAGALCYTTATGPGSVIDVDTQAECTSASGFWRAPSAGGSCITCHNVHVSLFLTSEEPKEPLRRECTTCHTKPLASMRHPGGGTTPAGLADTAGVEAKACEVCHMPEINGSLPVHLWRIKSDASYSTFPTAQQFGITKNADGTPTGFVATKKMANTAPDGDYANAVWVDVDYACGQCHGGSFGPTAVKYGAIYKSKTELATKAANIHNDKPIANFTYGLAYPAIDTVFVSSYSFCPSGSCDYSWAFGDGGTGTGPTATHQYAAGGTYPITLTVQDTATFASASVTNNVNVYLSDAAPVAHFLPTAGAQDDCASIVVGLGASFTDTSTDDHTPLKSVIVNWGDGSFFSKGAGGGSFTHTYRRAGKYTITQMVTDSAGNTNKRVCLGVVVPPVVVP